MRYQRFFGILRILLGAAYLLVPAYPLINGLYAEGDDRNRLYFTFLFFLLYAYSSITNGLRELRHTQPAFSLLRFFEFALNGFISLYLLILFATSGIIWSFRIIMLLGALVIIVSFVRDARIISRQYAERKTALRK
jgi:hypothetical protein